MSRSIEQSEVFETVFDLTVSLLFECLIEPEREPKTGETGIVLPRRD